MDNNTTLDNNIITATLDKNTNTATLDKKKELLQHWTTIQHWTIT